MKGQDDSQLDVFQALAEAEEPAELERVGDELIIVHERLFVQEASHERQDQLLELGFREDHVYEGEGHDEAFHRDDRDCGMLNMKCQAEPF